MREGDRLSVGVGEGYQCVRGLGYQWDMFQDIIKKGVRLTVGKGARYQWERGQALSEKGSRLSVRIGDRLPGREGGRLSV